MIPKYLATKFLNPLTEKLGYNINIIDENGMIIASNDKSRVDTFHEAAYKLIKEKQEIVKIYTDSQSLLGVKPGVNLPVHYNNDVIGVIGVTGDPDEVQAVAYAIKTSFETMIEYEFYKDSIFLRQSEKNIFINMLLYEKICDLKIAENMAKRLGYSSDFYRAPIIIRIKGVVASEEFLTLVKRNKLHSCQDISCITNDRNILVFKTIHVKASDIFGDYRRQVLLYIVELMNILNSANVSASCTFFVGNFEKTMTQYRYTYEQTHWCLDSIACRTGNAVFFIDHVETYLLSRIPRIELVNVFQNSRSVVEKLDKDKKLLNTMRAVYASGMNLQKAAAQLGVHRNTIYQRIKQLSDILGIDPLQDTPYNSFLYYFTRVYHSNSE